MRVTKIMKDHITETINKYYAPMINAIGKDYQEESKMINGKLEEIREQAQADAEKILANYPGYDTGYDNNKIFTYRSVSNYDKSNAINIARRALTNEKNEAIKNILLELDLGADKATFTKLLEKFQ